MSRLEIETDASRKADVLMKQYIKELVEGVFSNVRPSGVTADDPVDIDLRDTLGRVLESDSAVETRIRQFISDLYDDETAPQSLGSYEDSDRQWKKQLYERTLDWICEQTYRASRGNRAY